jgi:sulfide:quinone oxidoreductase
MAVCHTLHKLNPIMMATHERTRVLLAGGGVAALEAALTLHALAGDRITVELIAPETEFVYRPLAVAEPFRVGEVRSFPLQRLTEATGATLRRGLVTEVDPDLHLVTTEGGGRLPYDLLLLALGAHPFEAVPGALTFTGPKEDAALARVLEDAVHGEIQSIVFALPPGASWPMPLYELALLTRAYLVDHGTTGVKVTLVTPEVSPLEIFGPSIGEVVAELLEARGIELRLETTPLTFLGGGLELDPPGGVDADRVVALPWLEGPPLRGVHQDMHGFVEVDEHGAVTREDDLYAAGDLTSFPVKQGGIAAQQANAAAEAMAARAGAPIEPAPFRPVLRGLLLTGMEPRFLRGDAEAGRSLVDTEPLWWPPAKIVGRHLAPFLAEQLGLSESLEERHRRGAVPIEVELSSEQRSPGSPP